MEVQEANGRRQNREGSTKLRKELKRKFVTNNIFFSSSGVLFSLKASDRETVGIHIIEKLYHDARENSKTVMRILILLGKDKRKGI